MIIILRLENQSWFSPQCYNHESHLTELLLCMSELITLNVDSWMVLIKPMCSRSMRNLHVMELFSYHNCGVSIRIRFCETAQFMG